MKSFTISQFTIALLLASVFGCRSDTGTFPRADVQVSCPKLSTLTTEGWEAYRRDPVSKQLKQIEAGDLVVVSRGVVTAPGDGLTFTFDFDGKQYGGTVPKQQSVSWRPVLVSPYSTTGSEADPFVVLLKKYDKNAG